MNTPACRVNLAAAKQFDLQEFFWLCLPALLVGLALRAHFLWVTPQGYFGADSGSYYEFTYQLFANGQFELPDKRRWLYPIVLALVTAIPAPCWYVLPLVQHLIGLATVVGIGWVTLRLSVWPRFTVPLVTLICAIWPRMLWYEHEFIAETFLLAAFVLTIALALTPGLFRSRRGLFLLSIATILLAGMKGAGRFLWLGTIVGILVFAGDPRRWAWTWKSGIASLTALILAVTVGKSSQDDWLLLSSVMPMVRENGEPHGRYRQALRPLILDARDAGDGYPWVAKKYKKMLNKKDPAIIHPDWVELYKNRRRFSKVARSFSIEAIRDHPARFLQFTLAKTRLAMSDTMVQRRIDPPVFWEEQWRNTQRRWREDPSFLTMAFRTDLPQFHRLAREGREKTYGFLGFLEIVDFTFRWVEEVGGQQGLASLRIKPFGLLVVLGALLSLRPGSFRRSALLLLPVGLYTFGVFAVGDAVSRYLLPVEWVGIILAILALEILLRLLRQSVRRLRCALAARSLSSAP
jgi:hypothetical protein